jgi:opacity protein-like surface antigen
MKSKGWVVFLVLLVVATSAWAESNNENINKKMNASTTATQTSSTHYSNSTGLSWQGWGVRAGVTNDADQVVGGAQFNLGDIVSQLRFQPDVQLGVGNDVTTLYGTAPVYYHFGGGYRMSPYAGGGLSIGWVDVDNNGVGDGDSSIEMGAKATGGLEWPRQNGQAFFVELSLGFGDVHDATVVAAWTF